MTPDSNEGGRSGRSRAVGVAPQRLLREFERWTNARCELIERSDGVTLRVSGERILPSAEAAQRRSWSLGGGRTLKVEAHSGGTGASAGESEAGVEEGAIAFLGQALAELLASDDDARFYSRELAERNEEVMLLTSISETLGSEIRLDRAAELLLGELVDVMGAERAVLWLHDEARAELRSLATVGPGVGLPERISCGEPGSTVAAVFAEGEPRLCDDEPGLTVPVGFTSSKGNTRGIGVLSLLGRRDGQHFTLTDQRLMTAVANQIGAAVENGRLVAEGLERERMLAELDMAHGLQLKLLPDPADFSDICDAAARFEPAESVGGDFYHLIRLPAGRIGVMLGDVSSHGFSAALIMALTMSAVAIYAREREDPADVLRAIHQELIRKLSSTEMYLTVCYVVIDPARGRMRYANAGHPHAYRIRGGDARRLDALDPPLGIVELGAYSARVFEWNPAEDLLLMFTDGLSECLDTENLWSDERLTDLAGRRAAAGAREVVDTLFSLACAPPNQPLDDRTALVVRT